jgi:hypothetical protein
VLGIKPEAGIYSLNPQIRHDHQLDAALSHGPGVTRAEPEVSSHTVTVTVTLESLM